MGSGSESGKPIQAAFSITFSATGLGRNPDIWCASLPTGDPCASIPTAMTACTNRSGRGTGKTDWAGEREGTLPDMALHDVTAYGEQVGETYDRVYGAVLDTDGAVERLLELADGGPVLELGVGTGRLALPLAGHGLEVTGVDSSPAMLEQLTAKARAAGMPLIEGDFTDVVVGRSFRLVVLAFNTLFALPTQDAQVACFANAARHLEPGGRFVVEAWIHDRTWFRKGVGLWPRVRRGNCDRPRPRRPGQPASRRDGTALLGRRSAYGRHAAPLRQSGGARPHGPPRRTGPRASLGELAGRPVRSRQRTTCLRVPAAVELS